MFTLVNYVIDNLGIDLLNYPNVFAVGASFKIKDNKITEFPSLTFSVSKKYSKDYFSKDTLIPSSYMGAITDVIETPIPKPNSLTNKIRPVQGGYIIRSEQADLFGTAGCIVYREDNSGTNFKCMLTSGHIVSNNWTISDPFGRKAYQPNLDNNVPDKNIIGTVWEYIKPNIVPTDKKSSPSVADAALIVLKNSDLADSTIYSIGKLTGIADPAVSMSVSFCGAMSGRKEGVIQSANTLLVVPVDDPPTKKIAFSNLITTTKMSVAGDSGGILVTSNNKALGLLYGSSTQSSYWCNFRDIFGALRLSNIFK